ncbi:COX15/CtaA family protein [Flavobacteriaceae bacterium]|nr:COX15/CtaA family protein [Flavobacteriaceae bacterium]
MNRVYKITFISIIIVYLVILAGGIVRMTGSGMGCPDWPKCFGFLIPPTERSQLEWKPNSEYNKNQIIIIDKNLYYSVKSFNSKEDFNRSNWNKYTKHDYSKFNVYHTWIEYINRLIGALAGLSVLMLFLYSMKFFKSKKIITFLSFLSLIAILFQAWLGKTVVDSNLTASTITIHMLMAIVLLFILFSILAISKPVKPIRIPRNISTLILISMVLLIIQVLTGTEVRKFIDLQMEMYNYNEKNKWIENITSTFNFHRSFSWAIIIINSIIYLKIKEIDLKSNLIYIINGIIMYYFHFPFTSQPIHLLISTLIIGLQFYFLILYNLKTNATKI